MALGTNILITDEALRMSKTGILYKSAMIYPLSNREFA